MNPLSYRSIAANAFWHQNAGLVQLLGLCPLLAVSNTLINGLGLGLATLCIVTLCNLCVSLLRRQIRTEIRIPFYVLTIATLVSALELLMQAYLYALYLSLGIFIPLIVTNCMIIGRAEAFACKHRILPALVDGFMTGLGFAMVLVILGAMREVIGSGHLFQHADQLFGFLTTEIDIALPDAYRGFLLASLPPGAFIGLALLVALKQKWMLAKAASTQPRITLTAVSNDPTTD